MGFLDIFKRNKHLKDVYNDHLDDSDENFIKKREKDARKKRWKIIIVSVFAVTTFGVIIGQYMQNTKLAKQHAIEQKRLAQEELDRKNE